MKIRKELWFGFSLMGAIIACVLVFTPWSNLTNGHLGIVMLALIVVAIMLGFPTAFTLMGLGVFFAWLAYRSVNPEVAIQQVLDLMVQRAYGVMSNDVLIAVPLFVFMGYLVERAALIDRLFKSLHLASARVPGALAVATIVTCAIFATATGIVGAVVTLMGLLAFPAMLRAGYSIQVAAGAVTAGGCLGILIPPSVLLIVYGATAGVSVVQLYAGAFFPGLMLAALYVGYVIVLAKLRPGLMPALPASERQIPVPAFAQALGDSRNAVVGLWRAVVGPSRVPRGTAVVQLFVSMLPALALAALIGAFYYGATGPVAVQAETEVAQPVEEQAQSGASEQLGGPEQLEELTSSESSPQASDTGAQAEETSPPAKPDQASAPASAEPAQVAQDRLPAPGWIWIVAAVGLALLLLLYWIWTWERHELFKMLLTSFFPLTVLILFVLGSIVFGLATPTEAAAVGAFGGFLLAVIYRLIANSKGPRRGARSGVLWRTTKDLGGILKESSFLTARTSAMVCWLFVGSAIFSAAFALLGGQQLVERWVLSLDLTPLQFMILAQFIIFILGWPLEWTEIIVIFMPIFVPLLPHFNIDPLFFGLLVALNLQTAFLSPPVAMAAFYLKGVAPPHVTLNQIFAGMLPFLGIQVIALIILYVFPQIGLWLPSVVYGR